jgi:potassium/hydrogen antiporter
MHDPGSVGEPYVGRAVPSGFSPSKDSDGAHRNSPVVWVGVAGTFVTAATLATLAHALFGLEWRAALLLGTAVAPTDPAAVFSVLGRREVAGRSGTILEGEAGANDLVGIALMASLLTADETLDLGAAGAIAGGFLLQLAVGAVVGAAGGALLVGFMRRVPLPSEALYPLRVLASALLIYGAATVAHGSGFLAVFVAGILAGDARAPYKGEIERFHAALASLAEIVAFVALGLTVGLHTLPDRGALRVGLALAVLLTFVVRPLLVGLLLLPVRLARGERLPRADRCAGLAALRQCLAIGHRLVGRRGVTPQHPRVNGG